MEVLVSLIERELHQFREEVRLNSDRIEQAARRYPTAITAGTFSIGGLTEAIERVEGMIQDRDKEIAELRSRVAALEAKSA